MSAPSAPGHRQSAAAARRARRDRILYPVAVAVVLLALWQGLVTGLELPHYLVPSPLLMASTLVDNFGALMLALWVTLKVTLLAFVLATVVGC
jgi:NitT/TauT family transport system permease protein